MGHALQDTIMDILIRHHRMLGETTMWVPGTDHAAIATNKIIESQLHEEGKTRQDIGREAFLKRTDEWYAKTGSYILNQMKRLGCSCDWTRTRFTMDEAYYEAVQQVFLQYYEKGYIYRGARLVNWDPKTQTTVSDLEVIWETEKAPFYTLQYGPFQIGTARPETKFGDKYVVMHPDDARYAQYTHGQTITVEWINGPITATIIKDTAIDPKFGTGVMTMTPWHDATDFDIAQRHHLEMEQIIAFDGTLLPIAQEFAGMPLSKARPLIVEKLRSKGLVVDVDENYEHNIALNERGRGVIEPQVMRQWFVDMSRLKQETIDVVKNDLIEFVPSRWKHHFLDWMENVRDWNINRQIWLGHRLPVWWKPGTHGTAHEEGNFVVSLEKPAGDWVQDPDVLDTWFSSALWPFATLGWPDNTEDLQTFYPTSVVVTAREILYLWVARMIFSGLELMQGSNYGNRTQEQRIPFHSVFIHPTVLAKNGQRMSKSLGTGIDPLDLIEKYGADATRFGLMYQMSHDQQAIKFDERALESARNFGNKIWNIARLLTSLPERQEETIADAWIELRFAQVAQQVTADLHEYKLGEAARRLYSFVWNDFADWYVELLKHAGSRDKARAVFTKTLQLLHPFMPHITEVLWSVWEQPGMIATSAWPLVHHDNHMHETQAAMAYIQQIITTVRSARVLLGIAPGASLDMVVEAMPQLPEVVEAIAKVTFTQNPTTRGVSFVIGDGKTGELISPDITPKRIDAAITKLTKEQTAVRSRLQKSDTVLAQMEGKAAPEKIAAKKNERAKDQQHLHDIEKSLSLLQKFQQEHPDTP